MTYDGGHFSQGAILAAAFYLILFEATHLVGGITGGGMEAKEAPRAAMWGTLILVGFITSSVRQPSLPALRPPPLPLLRPPAPHPRPYPAPNPSYPHPTRTGTPPSSLAIPTRTSAHLPQVIDLIVQFIAVLIGKWLKKRRERNGEGQADPTEEASSFWTGEGPPPPGFAYGNTGSLTDEPKPAQGRLSFRKEGSEPRAVEEGTSKAEPEPEPTEEGSGSPDKSNPSDEGTDKNALGRVVSGIKNEVYAEIAV